MNAEQQGILTLIRSGLTGECLPLPEGFDPEAAYPMMARHQVQALCYAGAVNCGAEKEPPVMKGFFQSYVQAMLHSERQMLALERLTSAFSGAGIDHLLLKGSVLKQLYPKPELRRMGDADILIRESQYEAIRPLMQELGFEEDHIGPYDHTWNAPGLHTELHYQLASHDDPDFLAYFGDGWQRAVETDVRCRYAYTPEDHLVYLVMHLAKHYRDGGIGLKHAVDLWVYDRAYPNLDRGYLQRELERLRLWTFYCNVEDMLQVWFEGRVPEEKTEFLTETFFASGAFGAYETFLVSKGVRAAARSGSDRAARLHRTLEVLFPSRASMALYYPVLKKAPALLPVMWVLRGFRIVFVQPEKIRRQKAEIETAAPDSVARRREALNYVGLDFHSGED